MAITRKLLVVATLAWVAPLSAHQVPAAVSHQASHCPYKRAAIAAAQPKTVTPAPTRAPAKSAAPVVVVVEGSPGAASALGVGRSPVFMP